MPDTVSTDSAQTSYPDYSNSGTLSLPGTRYFNGLERFLYWLYVLSFSLDFRGPKGGSDSQYFMLVVCFLSAFFLILFGPHKKGPKSLHAITLMMLVFCGSTFIPLLAYGVPLERYVRVAGPFFLFATSLFMVYFLAGRKVKLSELLAPILVGSLISWIWSIFYAITFKDVSINTMRYQLLSPAQPFLIAFAFASLISGRFNLLGIVCLICSVLSTLISVTRQFIISYAFVLMVLLWVMSKSGLSAPEYRLRAKKGILSLFTFIIIGLILTILLRPDTFNTWYLRLFVLHDISNNTFLMRLAQSIGSWQELFDHPVYLLTGKGMGSTFHFPSEYGYFLQMEGIENLWEHADVMWDGIFHTAGVVFGGLFTYLLILSLISGIKTAKAYIYKGTFYARIWAMTPLAFVIQIFATSFFSNPWLNRFYAIIAGILIGSIFWMNDYIIHDYSASYIKQS